MPPDEAAADPERPLHTARLVLEPLAIAHADAMFDVLADPRIYEHENEPPRSRVWLIERYAKLATRRSADGREWWLNWIVRLRGADGAARACIGYVQASVPVEGGTAWVAYEFASRWWGLGYASEAVAAMLDELAARFAADTAVAVLKRSNARSARLLGRLGFAPLADADAADLGAEADERAMRRALAGVAR